MPPKSQTDNVRKRCDCVKWRQCVHPWYVDYQTGKRRFRPNLDRLLNRHCADFAEAKVEARRAWLAWLDGRSAADMLPADRPTLAALLEAYPVAVRRDVARSQAQARPIVRTMVHGRPFGDWRADEITRDMIEAFRRQRPLVAANRDLGLLRAVCNWAVLGGFLPRSPFRVGDVSAVSLAHEEARTRRLQPGEAERLALAAGGLLLDIITAALETGCRKGELLSLQWNQVRFSPRAELFLPAEKTKAKRDRRIPISTVLLPILTRRRLDPAEKPLPPEAYVFGDEVGRRRTSIKTAWMHTILRAYGVTPTYEKGTKRLTRAVRDRLATIDLHFHDLRREAGSRWMDAGIPLATIQRWLGHANISQTSTYLGASLGNDERDMQAFEARVGRPVSAPVTHGDAPGGSNTPNATATDQGQDGKTQQNPTVH